MAKRCEDGTKCRSGSPKRNILVYACSGGANVAEISDRAARELMFSGCGTMFCLAGLGAGLPAMVQTAKDADLNLVIDGCPVNCAKTIFDRAGMTNYRHITVTDLGIEKAKGVRCARAQVDRVVARAKEEIASS
jgi:uncharacterized metal-binding protein